MKNVTKWLSVTHSPWIISLKNMDLRLTCSTTEHSESNPGQLRFERTRVLIAKQKTEDRDTYSFRSQIKTNNLIFVYTYCKYFFRPF